MSWRSQARRKERGGWEPRRPGGGGGGDWASKGKGGGALLRALVAKARGEGKTPVGEGLSSAGHAGRPASVGEGRTPWQEDQPRAWVRRDPVRGLALLRPQRWRLVMNHSRVGPSPGREREAVPSFTLDRSQKPCPGQSGAVVAQEQRE